MVNPSTADANVDDATIRKIRGFAKGFHWSEFTVVNLFAYRATDVNELRTATDPIGPLNLGYILDALMCSNIVMVAWGSSGKLPHSLRDQWRAVAHLLRSLDKPAYCLGTCADGHPKHPLMIGYATQLTQWFPPN
jgi:hypothetical protein